MPYIKEQRREKILQVISLGGDLGMNLDEVLNPDELNYAICMIARHYWEKYGPSYQTINDIIGAMDGAKAEFRRRIVERYEDDKRNENGDVF